MSQELEQLQRRIDEAKTAKTKAETVVEGIEAGWEKSLGTKDVEEVEAKVVEMEKELAKLNDSYDHLISEARLILDTAGM